LAVLAAASCSCCGGANLLCWNKQNSQFELTAVGDAKIKVIKAVREAMVLGFKEA